MPTLEQLLADPADNGVRLGNDMEVLLKALLLALTPLVDERSISALLDVRGRGFDVAVIACSARSR